VPDPVVPGVVLVLPGPVGGAAGLLPGVLGVVVSVPEPGVVLLPVPGVVVLPVPGVLEGEPMPGVLLSLGLLPGVVLGLLPGVLTEPGAPMEPLVPVEELPLEPEPLVPDWAKAPPARTIAAPMVKPAIKFFFTMCSSWLRVLMR
jgi:hypothetical protein